MILVAKQLASNMTKAGMTPENERDQLAYNVKDDTLSYSRDSGTPLSDNSYGPCTLNRYNGQWVMFDEYGSSYIPITWDGSAWRAGVRTEC